MDINGKVAPFIGSLAVILFICCRYINNVYMLYTGNQSIMREILFVAIACCIIDFIISPVRAISIRLGVAITVLVLAYISTYLLVEERMNLELFDYLSFCVIPFLFLSIIRINYKKVLLGLMVLLCFSIPVFRELFSKGNYGLYYDAITMADSYAIIPIIMAGIMHFIYFRKEAKWYTVLQYIISVIYLLAFITMSYRGALVSVAFLFLFVLWERRRKKIRSLQIVVCICLFIAFAIVMDNFTVIAVYIQQLLSGFGIKIASIDKTLTLVQNNDFSQGRIQIYKAAVLGIINSPIWGHGLSTFNSYYPAAPYPHNFLLQLLYDGGLILTVPLMVGTIKQTKESLKRNQSNIDISKKVLVILLFGLTIVRVSFSADLWKVVNFWVLLGIVFNNRNGVESV